MKKKGHSFSDLLGYVSFAFALLFVILVIFTWNSQKKSVNPKGSYHHLHMLDANGNPLVLKDQSRIPSGD